MCRALWAAAVMIAGLSAIACGQAIGKAPILSEFLCNPSGDLQTEWIELYNPSDQTVLLTGYKIGDALGLCTISDTGLPLPPGEYIILAQDQDRFRAHYSDCDGLIASPQGWQILNNEGGETVRLADPAGRIMDSIYYECGFPYNRSWERYISPAGETFWGESFSPTGSSPGAANTYFFPRNRAIDLTISPDPFSPDGDGFEDVTVLRIDPPEADKFELAVYDISGRRVKTFAEADLSIPCQFTWDGRGDDGRVLPVGIYIVYARVEGGLTMEVKKTVVIAR